MQKLMGFLRLARPANIVTAFSDIAAGIAIGYFGVAQALIEQYPDSRIMSNLTSAWGGNYFIYVPLLLLSTLGLYGGGVVMNDVFDAKLDAIERPERPIPSGLIPKRQAAIWGLSLLLFGIICAGLVFWPYFFSLPFYLAVTIACAAVLYDAWGKHQNIFGPVNMGICRGLNLLLGMSVFPQMVQQYGYLAVVPVVYIAAITMISRGEVHGGKKRTIDIAAIFYIAVLLTIGVFGYLRGNVITTSIFLLVFGAAVFPPLLRARANPIGPNIGKAVKAGVLSLILMNASWAAAFGAPVLAVCILLLLPLSIWVAKAFAVT